MGLNETDIRRVIWTAVFAFVAAAGVLVPGVLGAPNLRTAVALGTSALVAGLAAAGSAVKNLVLGDESTLK